MVNFWSIFGHFWSFLVIFGHFSTAAEGLTTDTESGGDQKNDDTKDDSGKNDTKGEENDEKHETLPKVEAKKKEKNEEPEDTDMSHAAVQYREMAQLQVYFMVYFGVLWCFLGVVLVFFTLFLVI